MIPIRCFTCGCVLGDKWIPYITEIQNQKNSSNEKLEDSLELKYMDINLQKQVNLYLPLFLIHYNFAHINVM